MNDEKTLYLIDGHALAYRSYFATMRVPMSNSAGQPTGAVLAFTTSLLALLQNYRCSHVAIVFDTPRPTFRHEMYAEYKANRAAMPDDLISQMKLIMQVVDALNIPRISKEGLEADDIIATVTRRAQRQGYDVRVVTKDKDLMQLVGDGVKMLVPESGGKLVEMGPPEVREKMGVEPGQIRDLLALMGDTSDNVPGVPGVGPKTATKLLNEVGSIAAILENPESVVNVKLREKLVKNRDKLVLSRDLVTLRDDAEIGMDPDDLGAAHPDKHACVALFTELEFRSFLSNPLFDTRTSLEFSVRVPSTLDEVSELVAQIEQAGLVSVDTETDSTEPRIARLVGISCAVNTREAWYIPVRHVTDSQRNLPVEDVRRLLKPVLESESITKIGQNLKYDIQIFRGQGIRMRGISFDTMIAAYLIDPGKRQYGMDALASEWLHLSVTSIETLIGKRGKDQVTFDKVPVETAASYSGEDAIVPLLLKERFDPLLDERGLRELFDKIEMPLVGVLAGMEWHGVMTDGDLLGRLSVELGGELEQISQRIYTLAGEEFNLNSPKQIAEILFGKLGLPRSKKTKTGLSTDVTALENLAPIHPIGRELLSYRETQKLLSTYIDALPQQVLSVSGRVHSSFNQTIAATGRLSSTNPNLQNIPVRTDSGARIREAFIAPPGSLLVSADYSQIELRILAHLSKDALLIQAFKEDRDIHTQTASAMYGCFPEMVTPDMRRAAKTINFGLMYGMGPINLSRQLGISFKDAQRFIDTYFKQFPSIHAFMQRCIESARDKGFSETMFGRRRYLPDISSDRRQIREGAERTAINTPVQGSAADIIKIAMVDIAKDLGEAFAGVTMIMQVHDELVFEVPQERSEEFIPWVCARMGAACTMDVALKVEAGSGLNWRVAH